MNSNAKKRLNLRLSDNIVNYIDEASKNNNITKTEMVERIILAHQNSSSETASTDEIAEAVLARYKSEYKNYETRMRLATNYTEKNVQIIMEVLNSMLYNLKLDNACLTDLQTHPTLEDATELVTSRIANYKQKNDSAKGNN